MSGLPVDDWQFWVVSLLAIGGLALILRPLWASREDGCGTCTTNRPRSSETRVRLTLRRTERADSSAGGPDVEPRS